MDVSWEEAKSVAGDRRKWRSQRNVKVPWPYKLEIQKCGIGVGLLFSAENLQYL